MTYHKIRLGRFDCANFFCFSAYAACSIIVPMALVFLARDLGFALEDGGRGKGGALQLGRSTAMVASMLFCGFAAGRWGKKRSLAFAVLLMGAGTFLAAFSPVYAVLFLAFTIAGLGEGTIEGIATPAVQELHPVEPGRYINFSHSFWSIGVVGTVTLAGAMLYCGVSWRLLLLCSALFTLIPALCYLWPDRKNRWPEHTEKLAAAEVWGNARELLAMPRFWLYLLVMFLAGGGEFSLTFWIASFIQLEYAGSAWLGGLGTAIFAAGMIASRMGAGFLVPTRKLGALVIWCGVTGGLLGLLPPFMRNIYLLLPVLFLLGVVSGPFWPSIQSYADTRLKCNSTMLYILLSCAGIPGSGFFAWLMGALGDWVSRIPTMDLAVFGPLAEAVRAIGELGNLRVSFLLVPLCYFGLALLILGDAAHRPAKTAPNR